MSQLVIQETLPSERVTFRDVPEEIANTITHGIGFFLSLVGAAWLLRGALDRGQPWLTAGCAVYAMTLVGVYAFSTLSHLFQEPRRKRLFRVWDQGFIYLLIAGTYTPFLLAYLQDPLRWALLTAVWGVALAGFYSKIFMTHRVDAVSLIVYVLLGWLPVSASRPMLEALPPDCFVIVLTGGLCYSVGVCFLVLDRRVPYFHAVWHLLVIAGCFCHYAAIAFYVLPAA